MVGGIINEVKAENPDIPGYQVASALAIVAGGIVAALGFLRLGFIVDFIPVPAISAFMTGSAINIISGQCSKLLGETADFSTHGPTYLTIINTLKYLPTSTIDASLGFTALAMLYLIRFGCNYAAKKMPHRAKLFFFLSTLRTVFVILFYVMVSAAVNVHRKDDPMFDIIEDVPRGE
jgi:sodium-independent sulfate anion transporter 11